MTDSFFVAASQGGVNWELAVTVGVTVLVVSGVLYILVKFLSSMGMIVIPALCGLAAGALAESTGIGAVIAIPLIVSAGVAGSLSCAVLAEVRSISKALRK